MVWKHSEAKTRRGSNVDILIITTDEEPVQNRIAEILLDFQMEAGEPLEIVTSCLDERYPLIDPFMKNILAYGQEVYSMIAKDLHRRQRVTIHHCRRSDPPHWTRLEGL